MILNRWHTPSPRERCLRRTFAVLAFLFVVLSCLSLFGFSYYLPLEQISVITLTDAPFRSPQPQSYRTKPISVSVTRKSETENSFVDHKVTSNGSQSHTPKMCSDIFSIGKTRSTMTPQAKRVVSHIRRVKNSRKFRPFLRHEPYILLGDMMPVMFNSSTTSDNDTRVNFNKVWRMEQVAGLFPHLSCRLRDYSTAMLKQCLVNRRRRGKGTKLLFMGDSRVRQIVEVLLDVFRDMDFEITTYKEDILSLEEFMGLRAFALWTKYKKHFVARSKQVRDFEIEFCWTKIFDLKIQNVFVAEPATNGNETEVLDYIKSVDIAMRSLNNTHASSKNVRNEKRMKTSRPSRDTLTVTSNSMVESTSSKTFLDRQKTNIIDQQSELQSNTGDRNDIFPVSTKTDSTKHSTSSKGFALMRRISNNIDGVSQPESTPFETNPLKKLEKLLTIAPTEVPDIVVLGSGVWGLINSDPILRVLDEIALRQVAQLRPLLLRLRTVTQLVWVMPTPVDDSLFHKKSSSAYHTNMYLRNLEWVANAQVQLMAQGITVWDSFYPVAHASYNDCVEAFNNGVIKLPSHPKLSLLSSWLCADRVHTSNEAYVVAVEMVANQLCNGFMPRSGYCCED